MSIRDALLNYRPPVRRVAFKGIAEELYVRTLECTEYEELARQVADDAKARRIDGDSREFNELTRVRLVTVALCDKDGVRVLEDEDVEAVQKMPADLWSTVAMEAMAANGLGEHAVREAAKN